MDILHFNLLAPICYVPLTDADPFDYSDGMGDSLFCFELDKSQCQSIEPDATTLLGPLVFGGKAAPEEEGSMSEKSGLLELPNGHYLFAQERELLCRDAIITMALEIQKEGLWQRLKIGEKLYLRYLFEDGSAVTQLFRPYTG